MGMKPTKYKMNKKRLLIILFGILYAYYAVAQPSVEKENIAFQQAVYQSGAVDDDFCGHLVTDGSNITFWESKAEIQQWLYIDLGEACSLSGFGIDWGDNCASAYRIEASNESKQPKQWKTIYQVSSCKGGKEEYNLPSDTQAKWVRILISGTKQPNKGCIIREWRVYGQKTKKASYQNSVALLLPDGNIDLNKQTWKLQHAMFVNDGAPNVSRQSFDDSQWIKAVVPGTILGSYVAAGALPDPFFGDQMSMISERFFTHGSFWYRSVFRLPTNISKEKIWLNFEGINWKSEVYLNGHFLGNTFGAFIRSKFNITDILQENKENCIAVLIKPLDTPDPGKQKVTHKFLGCRTTNGDLYGYDSPAFLASAGWNWLPIIRGRNMGIWNDVYLSSSGKVMIEDSWVSTTLNLPDTTQAQLIVRTILKNTSNKPSEGILSGTIGNLSFSKKITLKAGEASQVVFDGKELSMQHPKLWWPNGYGAQHLYQLELSYKENGKISDRQQVTFGIRDLQCKVQNNILFVYVNGVRILLRGGNWGMDEGMLRCDAKKYDLMVRLHKEANFNMIRNWVGQIGKEEFYEVCNKYGILVFDDFWLANPNDGPDPKDYDMFMDNAVDKIKRVRKHPSVAFYCGRNEGYPPEDLDGLLREAVKEYDPTRHYVPNSADGTLTGLGPYDTMDTEWYFNNRGVTFHSEQGIIAIPLAASIRQMMPEENHWPINDMWAKHDYQMPRSFLFTQRIEKRFGIADNLDDYCTKAQMVNMEASKAMFECLQSRQGSGLLLWMSQSAWPSLICQLYDYYFEPTAAYFGVKRACSPIHILWDPAKKAIVASNNTAHDIRNYTAITTIYDIYGKEIWKKQVQVSIPAISSTICFPLEVPANMQVATCLIKLGLYNEQQQVAENFYWKEDREGTCLALCDLPKVPVKITTVKKGSQWFVKVSNESNVPALMLRLGLRNIQTKERVLPVFYSDNYISLLPGEKKEIIIEAEETALKQAELYWDGWNIPFY